MGNQGIDYFPMNVDFFSDRKIELIEGEFGIKGAMIAIRLLCKIYHEGFYYQWGDDECLVFSRKLGDGIVPKLVEEVVKRLVKRSFFDERLFNSFQILTSKGIQARYFEATKRRKDVKVSRKYLLVDVGKFTNVCIIDENVNISDENADISEQSKVNRKEKESKERKPPMGGKKKDELSFGPTPSPNLSKFLDWVKKNAPWCFEHLRMPTEEELVKLKSEWNAEDIMKIIKRLENKTRLRKQYSNLYETVQSWLEYDEERHKTRRLTQSQCVACMPPEQPKLTDEEYKEKSQREFIALLRRDAAKGKEAAIRELEKMNLPINP